ncbi:choline dehydrogenase [Phytoactinopolyspora alkaliphila]|uniref:Choline dehydrogenase n=1 Tax=Phytoactinopolyspora alkaliphila TaxID=1783498 RepID=A0A6N9YQE3_9ACTN|nr:choline dehydrogenase [Phytoactinopolyspora alkaliphila]NED97165.1 choline dehydrogenase [Phytoactinopolyspora alkaliphila]
MSTERYDYIIVGGGSAGCVLANRLSSDPSVKVLVLEAGRPDWIWDIFIHMPAALTMVIGNPLYDWRYVSEPEPYMGGRRVSHGRGKVLGGSSSINGMIFQRGNPLDLERWASDPGMETWDYAHCLPYFKRMENCTAGGDEWRGQGGPLWLERGPGTNPLFGAFLDAAKEAGYPLTSDVNGYQQEGFARFDRTIKKGRRWSAARAYLHPVKRRPNLTVRCLAPVSRVLFRGNQAVGVRYSRPGGRQHDVYGGEVVLAGGAINTPQLLQLSGVGNADELTPLGIDMVHHLPGVGENLQDHLEVYIQHACTQPISFNPALKLRNRPKIGLQWILSRSGPAATNHFEAGGFVRGNDTVKYPNLMFHFLPIAVRYDGTPVNAEHGYQVHIGPMYSDVRGSVKITSANPRRHPALRFNYLSTENDRREWVEAIRVAREILAQPAMRPFDGGELSPGPSVQSDDEILDWVARDAETAYHPSCSARMGVDEMSVVDPTSMRVHGVEALRVVDASAMPYLTNGNIYAPVIMLAEKAADLILGNTPLPASTTGFYRHSQEG